MTTRDLRPALWRLIRRVGAGGRVFDAITLQALLRGGRRERITDYLRALHAGGYLAPALTRDQAPGWQLVRDPGQETPRLHADGSPIVQGAGREQCWRAMRHLGTFGVAELVAAAGTERWRVAPGEAEDYCRRLARAGILRRHRAASGERWLYTLTPERFTGPLPPQILRSKVVLDANTGTRYYRDGRVEPVRAGFKNAVRAGFKPAPTEGGGESAWAARRVLAPAARPAPLLVATPVCRDDNPGDRHE
jgi:hypothetical protein